MTLTQKTLDMLVQLCQMLKETTNIQKLPDEVELQFLSNISISIYACLLLLPFQNKGIIKGSAYFSFYEVNLNA